MTENIVHKKYRVLVDEVNDVWNRISWWTNSEDVHLTSGIDLDTDLANKQTLIDANMANLATIETSSVSAHAYVKGQLLVYNNQLYRVISAITVGTTLSEGSNISAISISNISSMLVASDGTQFYFDYYNGHYGFYPNASKSSSQFVAIT